MIKATSGDVRPSEAWKAAEDEVAGLERPKPSNLHGRESSSLSTIELGGRPVSAEMKC